MKLSTLFATVAAATLLSSGAFAQDTLTGTNTANSGSNSTSGSNSAAIAGVQNTHVDTSSQSGAISGSNSAAHSDGNQTTTNTNTTVSQSQGQTNGQTNNQTTGATNTNIFQGTQIPRQTTATVYAPPQIVAPALSTTLTETCMGSGSAGVSTPWGGITGGKTYEDKQCIRRLNSRELAAQGFRWEACMVMMGDPEVAAAFHATGRSCQLAEAHAETSYPNVAPPPPPPPPPNEAPVSAAPPPAAPSPAERGIIQQDVPGERGALSPNPDHKAVEQLLPGTMAPIPNPN